MYMKAEKKHKSKKFIKELKGIKYLNRAESFFTCTWEYSSKAQRIIANDNTSYIVKFKNNPQSTRVLANEIIANSIAKLINIPIPEFSIINIDDKLVKHINNINKVDFISGNQFASKYISNSFVATGEFEVPLVPINTYVPTTYLLNENFETLKKTINFQDWTKVIIFETLIQNIDFRKQNILFNNKINKFYTIDHGFAFKNQKWSEINFKNIKNLLYFNAVMLTQYIKKRIKLKKLFYYNANIRDNILNFNKKKKINTIFNEIIDTFKINDENIKKIINIPVLEEWGIDSKDKTVIADYITDFNKNTKKIINMIRK